MSNRLPNSTRRHESERLSRVRQRHATPGQQSPADDSVRTEVQDDLLAHDSLPKPLIRIPRLGDIGRPATDTHAKQNTGSYDPDTQTRNHELSRNAQESASESAGNDVGVQPMLDRPIDSVPPQTRIADPATEDPAFGSQVQLAEPSAYSSASSSVLNELELSALGCHPLQSDDELGELTHDPTNAQTVSSGYENTTASMGEAIAVGGLSSTPIVLQPAVQPEPVRSNRVAEKTDSADLAKAKRQRMMYEILFQVALTIALIGMLLLFHALVSGGFARNGSVQEDSVEAPNSAGEIEDDELGSRLDPPEESSPSISSIDRPRIRVTGLDDDMSDEGTIRQATYEDQAQSTVAEPMIDERRSSARQQTVPQHPPRQYREQNLSRMGQTVEYPNHLYSRDQPAPEFGPANEARGTDRSQGGQPSSASSENLFRQPAAGGNRGLRMP